MKGLSILAAGAILAGAAAIDSGKPLVATPLAPEMTEQGLRLVLEYEVGGKASYDRWPRPEYIGDSYSGVTWGIGYDSHQNSRFNIVKDWTRIGDRSAARLAETQPFYGHSAKGPAAGVKDIVIPWDMAVKVFMEIDLARVDAQCKRAFPGFDTLRPAAKDAIRSLVFNRGASMIGPGRVEMRAIRDDCTSHNYEDMARQEIAMCRIWKGTNIEAGMKRRRYAEAELFRIQ
jgi:hypothetical protein